MGVELLLAVRGPTLILVRTLNKITKSSIFSNLRFSNLRMSVFQAEIFYSAILKKRAVFLAIFKADKLRG